MSLPVTPKVYARLGHVSRRLEMGSAPQHVCSATGPGRRQILGPARHPVCDIPNRLLRHALIELACPRIEQLAPGFTRAGCRPTVVDIAHPGRTDDPHGICPA